MEGYLSALGKHSDVRGGLADAVDLTSLAQDRGAGEYELAALQVSVYVCVCVCVYDYCEGRRCIATDGPACSIMHISLTFSVPSMSNTHQH